MTNEEINQLIAEWCGWTRLENNTPSDDYGPKTKVWFFPAGKHGEWKFAKSIEQLPDYCNDLNAMHEAENYLEDSFTDYLTHLTRVTSFENRFEVANRFMLVHATARQRAEALLRTIGKE